MARDTEKIGLGARLKSLRQQRRPTLSQASKLTGLAVSTLSKVETARPR